MLTSFAVISLSSKVAAILRHLNRAAFLIKWEWVVIGNVQSSVGGGGGGKSLP